MFLQLRSHIIFLFISLSLCIIGYFPGSLSRGYLCVYAYSVEEQSFSLTCHSCVCEISFQFLFPFMLME
uniref:Uncharacterized protein n=1 Tax=Rhizophora mucronata TaxID=61149 RepID=A0A2P2MU13_RHIMU